MRCSCREMALPQLIWNATLNNQSILLLHTATLHCHSTMSLSTAILQPLRTITLHCFSGLSLYTVTVYCHSAPPLPCYHPPLPPLVDHSITPLNAYFELLFGHRLTMVTTLRNQSGMQLST